MPDNKTIAADVLEAVGGKENVTSVTHCMTRLRFTLKDSGIPAIDQVKKIDGVLGAQEAGGQFQVIIGQNVPKVYDEVCALGGFAKKAAIDENLDTNVKQPLTPRVIGKNILNYLSGSMFPLIPILMCAGLFKCLGTILGPTMLNVLSAESDFVVLMDILYNACFHFLPIYLGFNAAKQIGVTPILGAFMGGIMVEPTFAQMAADGTPFTVYGIPCTPEAYAQTVLPILLSVFAMSYIERFVRRVMPDMLSTVFTPLVTMAIAVPLSLCLLGPIGQWCGQLLSTVLNIAGSAGGIVTILASGVLCALWLPLIVTGMHGPIILLAIANLMATGSDTFILVIMLMNPWVCFGLWFGGFLKLRDKKEKSLAFGYFISNFIGGVSEPGIYGLLLRYRRLLPVSIVSAFITGVLARALGLTLYVPASSNFLAIFGFAGGSATNFTFAIACSVFAFVLTVVLTFLFGFTADEVENGPASERA